MTLQELFPNTPKETLDTVLECIKDLSKQDQILFLAQTAYESGQFLHLEENLHYSSARLLQVFPSHFNSTTAIQCQNTPKMIANIIYGNRLGNIEANDGYKYRGRGLIQLTGRANYESFLSNYPGKDENWLGTIEGATQSAIWFFQTHHIFGRSIIDSTKIINGGTNGLADRIKLFQNLTKCYQP